jgi:aspartyl-tRNA(Asn)/glutamyl-tRNA(Gln) amidotransferase subunit B
MADDVMIGLETHIQLDTATKLFCDCPNAAAKEPNTHTCETCLGMPGSKPVPNKQVIDWAIQTGLALDCDIDETVVFARKTYFYPDMSKNFQITQYDEPIATDGAVSIDGTSIGIKRVHIEEDPAQLVHRGGSMDEAAYTTVDYNRAGTPLLEVVTEPDFTAPAEAREYLQKLIRILQYLGVYDPERLAVKSDANVSVAGGNRVEVKNITGTRAIADALEYEIRRQRRQQSNGGTVAQQTRRYDNEAGMTEALRTKESEADYGYIVEPDLIRIAVPDDRVQSVRERLPELPDAKRQRFIDEYHIEAELADALITDPQLADAFEDAVDAVGADLAASWFSGPIKKTLNYHELTYSESPLRSEWIVTVLEKLQQDEISDNAAETVIQKLVDTPRDPATIIDEQGLEKAAGDELVQWVDEAIEEHPDAVDDYRNGDEEAINFLVGQVMQKSQGSADPKETRDALQDALE